MYLFELQLYSGTCPEVGLLDHMVALFLVFKEPPYFSPQKMYHFTFLPTVQKGSLFFTPSPTFIVFIHISAIISGVLSIFLCVIGHLYVFREMHVQFFHLFFDCFFSLTCLYILKINPLSVTSFANIFSHSAVVFLFIVFFAVQKILNSIRSVPFVYFCLYFHYSRRWVKKDLAVIYVNVLPVFL